jgi:hypothetical protein
VARSSDVNGVCSRDKRREMMLNWGSGAYHHLPGNYQLVNRLDGKSRISTEKCASSEGWYEQWVRVLPGKSPSPVA